MRIEDYWCDAFIYEVEYKMNKDSSEKLFFGYVCCKADMPNEYLNNIVEKKVKVEHKNAVCIKTKEIYSALVDKKIECKADFLSSYFIIFNVNFRNRKRVIEKIILEEPTVSMNKINSKIISQFSNVVEVVKVTNLNQEIKIICLDWM